MPRIMPANTFIAAQPPRRNTFILCTIRRLVPSEKERGRARSHLPRKRMTYRAEYARLTRVAGAEALRSPGGPARNRLPLARMIQTQDCPLASDALLGPLRVMMRRVPPGLRKASAPATLPTCARSRFCLDTKAGKQP